MAIPAQGCVVTWTSYGAGASGTIAEVQTMDVRTTIERLEFRGRAYFFPGGEITLTGFSTAILNARRILSWGTLKITVPTGGGNLVLHEGYAQLLGCNTRATVNEAVLFAFQFRLWGSFLSTGTTE